MATVCPYGHPWRYMYILADGRLGCTGCDNRLTAATVIPPKTLMHLQDAPPADAKEISAFRAAHLAGTLDKVLMARLRARG